MFHHSFVFLPLSIYFCCWLLWWSTRAGVNGATVLPLGVQSQMKKWQHQLASFPAWGQCFALLHCLNTVGWVTGRVSSLWKICLTYLPSSVSEQLEEENQGEPANPGSAGTAIKWKMVTYCLCYNTLTPCLLFSCSCYIFIPTLCLPKFLWFFYSYSSPLLFHLFQTSFLPLATIYANSCLLLLLNYHNFIAISYNAPRICIAYTLYSKNAAV